MWHLNPYISIISVLFLVASVLTFSRGITNAPAAVDSYDASTSAVAFRVQNHITFASTSASSASKALQAALVNIICYAPTNGTLHSISGSGIIINPKGIILTNAHIAQYFLLANHGVSCAIRTGGPATAKYKASLMYISPEWLRANANVLTETNPQGTGQYDFALLIITTSINSARFPVTFPYVPLANGAPSIGTPVVIASYGAQSLKSTQILSDLFPTVVSGSVKDVYTFAINSVDVIALGGSAAAQSGSSGGGVINAAGDLVGTLTTSTINGATSTRALDAITTLYIQGEYVRETRQSLDSLLVGSSSIAVANEAAQIPALESLIATQLP